MKDKKLKVLGIGIVVFLAVFYTIFYLKEAEKGAFDEPPEVQKSEELVRNFSNWKEYTSSIGHFTASFPKAPAHSSEAVPFSNIEEKGVMNIFISQETDGTQLMVRSLRYPKGYDRQSNWDLLREPFDMIVNSRSGNVARQVDETKFNDLPALLFQVENEEYRIKGESILSGDTLYTLVYTTRVTHYDEKVWEHFISSFVIENK